jgi:hypothetical protein
MVLYENPLMKRNIMKIKNALNSIGHGMIDLAVAAIEAPLIARRDEIDAEIAKLQEERAEIEKKLNL